MVSKKDRSEIGRQLAALRKKVQVTCAVCGVVFTATRRRMYCSAKCNMAAYRQRKREADRPTSPPAEM
jgi:hypothetical protein